MMQENKGSAAGDIITTPRSLYINFHNIWRRKLTVEDFEKIKSSFQKIAANFNSAAEITTEILMAEPIPGDKHSIKLVPAEIVNAGNCANLRVLRLTFADVAQDRRMQPLQLTLDMDLSRRDQKSVTVRAITADLSQASPCYALYNQLEELQGKGILNNISARFEACDGSFHASMSSYKRGSFILRY